MYTSPASLMLTMTELHHPLFPLFCHLMLGLHRSMVQHLVVVATRSHPVQLGRRVVGGRIVVTLGAGVLVEQWRRQLVVRSLHALVRVETICVLVLIICISWQCMRLGHGGSDRLRSTRLWPGTRLRLFIYKCTFSHLLSVTFLRPEVL